ncbi:Site-specific recombinase XerD [Allokutzneria albata]|uniref:Site-specific recombinase XerD n=2 Tax=Allokutzneria albata TaxID=211114 RepID=A0A1H0CAV0_ALLAB|nr:Site-specific recombinase XerD [Allokutzneria albata]
MARPPLPIGMHGKITVYKVGERRFRARTKVRDHDGVVRQVERWGTSKTAAEMNLKTALAERRRVSADNEITADTKIAVLGEAYLAKIDKAVRNGKLSPTTGDQYRYRFERHIKDGIGRLAIREALVSRLDALVADVAQHYGASGAKTTRTVLSGMFGLAVRHDALDRNPVREIDTVESEGESARALTLDEAILLRAKIHAHEKARGWDLPDFTDMMLASGLRIGEAAAITWDALDLDAGTLEVRATVVRVKGVGLVLKPKTKSKSGFRTLELPTWAVQMLKARRDRVPSNEWNVVFTAPAGGLRDPSNTQADLRVVFADAGFEWVTSHVYRKTVATLMDHGGLTARAAADQLGHAKVSMTQDRYFGRKVAKTGAAALLEAVAPEKQSSSKVGEKLGQSP